MSIYRSIKNKAIKYTIYSMSCMLISVFIYIFLYIFYNAYLALLIPNIKLNINFSNDISSEYNKSIDYITEKINNRDLSVYILKNTLFKEIFHTNHQNIQKSNINQQINYEIEFPIYLNNIDDATLKKLSHNFDIQYKLNLNIFSKPHTSNYSTSGLLYSMKGTFYILSICLMIALFLGILSGIYIREIMSNKKIKKMLLSLIFNMNSVPTIVIGLFVVYIFIESEMLEKSSSLIGGIALGIIAAPQITISTIHAMDTVPDKIRYASYGLGASKAQTIMYNILPAAMPLIVKGVVMSIVRSMGEIAPLMIIGLLITTYASPNNIYDPTGHIILDIYQWSKLGDTGFLYLSYYGIALIILFVILLNAICSKIIKNSLSKF